MTAPAGIAFDLIDHLVDPEGRAARHWPDTADAATITADLAAVLTAATGGRAPARS